MKRLMILLLLVVLVAGCTQTTSEPVHDIEFGDRTLHFRADLNEANKVPVIPDENELFLLLANPFVEKMRIYFIPSEMNGYYSVAGYEMTYKLVTIHKSLNGKVIQIEAVPINSTDEITASEIEPAIFMKMPANNTAVIVEENNYIVNVFGNSTLEDKTYSGLDLAADKLLLSIFSKLETKG